MQERIVQTTKMVTHLTKGKGITDDPSLRGEPTLRKDDIDPSIEPNLENPCEQERLMKDPSGRVKHVDMQQRCSLLGKKLKEIEGVDDLGSMYPKKFKLSPQCGHTA